MQINALLNALLIAFMTTVYMGLLRSFATEDDDLNVLHEGPHQHPKVPNTPQSCAARNPMDCCCSGQDDNRNLIGFDLVLPSFVSVLFLTRIPVYRFPCGDQTIK